MFYCTCQNILVYCCITFAAHQSVTLRPVHVYQGVTDKACFTFNKHEMNVSNINGGAIRTGDNDTVVAEFNINGTIEGQDYTGRISNANVTQGDGDTIEDVYICIEHVTVADVNVYYIDIRDKRYKIHLFVVGK